MATAMRGFAPVRSRLAFQLDRVRLDAFVCRRCIQHQSPAPTVYPLRQTPFLQAFKQRSPTTAVRKQSSAALPSFSSSSLGALGSKIAENATKARSDTSTQGSTFWPRKTENSVGYWLLASAASVFGIVIFGGLTRLTESGLSITEWRPVTGSLPPFNEQVWQEEFDRYKRSPEFQVLNSKMNLEEFKKIYWMEWTHRLWGRVVGLTFLFPTIYFIARRKVRKDMAIRLVGICGLIGMQGVIGWWMVASGLKDDLFAEGSHPRVSQYRLATHLGTAFIAYFAMFSNGVAILRDNAFTKNPASAVDTMKMLDTPQTKRLRLLVNGLAALVFVTAMSGALVAGLDAGLIYNDFPWMGQGLLPPKRELFDPFYSHTESQSDLYWRNALENPVLVQLDHRILATTTFAAIIGLWLYTRSRRRFPNVTPAVGKSMLGVVHLACLQVTLGITTLWYLVPLPLAAAHQGGALALLTGVFLLRSRLYTQHGVYRTVMAFAKRKPETARSASMRQALPGKASS